MFNKILFKESVRIKELNWQILSIFEVVSFCYDKENLTPVCTSVNDGVHMQRSYHYKNLAADFSIVIVKGRVGCFKMVEEIRKLLGTVYDVILEDDHIHIEFDLVRYNMDSESGAKEAEK